MSDWPTEEDIRKAFPTHPDFGKVITMISKEEHDAAIAAARAEGERAGMLKAAGICAEAAEAIIVCDESDARPSAQAETASDLAKAIRAAAGDAP